MSLTDESLQAVSCNNQTQNNQKCAHKKNKKKHECVYYWAHTSWHTEQHRTVIVIFPLTSSGHAVSTSRVPSAVPVYMTTHKCFLSTCIRRDVIGDDQQQQQLSVITMLVCGVGVMSGNRMSTNSFCLHICLGLCVFSSVCPSVCLSVCLWAGLLVMLWINFCKVCVRFFLGGGGYAVDKEAIKVICARVYISNQINCVLFRTMKYLTRWLPWSPWGGHEKLLCSAIRPMGWTDVYFMWKLPLLRKFWQFT